MPTTQTKLQVAAGVTGLLAASALVFGASQAAFSGTTANTGNSWSAATVVLTDDDAGSASFTTTDMVPGDVDNACIEVTYTGSSFDLTSVRLYGTSGGTVLADDLDVQIAEVDDCATKANPTSVFSGALSALPADYATSATGFMPASGDTTRGYDITVTLGTDTPNTAQGLTATADLTWEIRSNDTTP